MGLIRGVFLSCALVAAFGCAKDMSLKDYQDQDALDELAKFQAVAGVYTGMLKNSKGLPLGGIELTLEASLSSQGSGGSGGGAQAGAASDNASTHAVLTTQLRFADKVTTAIIRTANGHYDPASGIYVADFAIDLTDNTGKVISTRQLKLTGNIGDGHVRGSMQGVGFPSQRAGFDAAKGGDSIENLSKAAKPIPGSLPEGVAVKFSGKMRSPPQPDPDCVPSKKKKCPPIQRVSDISMFALFPINNSAEHFANIFLPENSKILEVSLNISDTVYPNFPRANWDSDSNRLIAESVWSGPTTGQVTRHLTCADFYFAHTTRNFRCQFWTDRTEMAVINFGPAESANP